MAEENKTTAEETDEKVKEVEEIEEVKEIEINNKKEIIICCGIQVNCNDKKHNMLEKAEKYISQAKEELNKKGKEMDLLVLPEQFVQLPETAEYYKEPYGIIDKNTETDVTGITSRAGLDIDIKRKENIIFKFINEAFYLSNPTWVSNLFISYHYWIILFTNCLYCCKSLTIVTF